MIFELLSIGEDNAISGRQICKMLNLEPRALTIIIERERREGKPICASCNGKTPGYYIPEDKEAMQRYCAKLLHRLGEIAKTRDSCLKTIKDLPEGGVDNGE